MEEKYGGTFLCSTFFVSFGTFVAKKAFIETCDKYLNVMKISDVAEHEDLYNQCNRGLLIYHQQKQEMLERT